MGVPTRQCLKTQPSVEYGCEVKARSRGLCAFCFCTRGNCFGIRAVEEGYPRLR